VAWEAVGEAEIPGVETPGWMACGHEARLRGLGGAIARPVGSVNSGGRSFAVGGDVVIDPTYAAELLARQDALQVEAVVVVAELDLPALLVRAGRVEQIGSSVSGLMVWRDLDFNIVAPALARDDLVATIAPLLTDVRVFDLHFQDEVGPRNFSGDPHDDRYYVVFRYRAASGEEWKIDLSFWLADAPRGQLAHLDYLRRTLTDETRLAILALKDLWHRLPAYPYTVGGYEIYDAVLEHGVRTPDDLDAYLRARGLPTRHEGMTPRRDGVQRNDE
jgi:hypothetical protein